MQINVRWLFSVPTFFDHRAETRSAKHGIEASKGVDLPKQWTVLPTTRGSGTCGRPVRPIPRETSISPGGAAQVLLLPID